MSMSLEQVLNEAGYDFNTKDDATWLLSKVSEFEALVANAEDLLERFEEERQVKLEKELSDE